MRQALRFYDYLITGLAVVGGLSIVLLAVAIIVDVFMRNIGVQPFRTTSTLVEYVMLFSTMAAAPWLVRTRRHISIQSFVSPLPPKTQQWIGRAVLTLCFCISGLLGVRSGVIAVQVAQAGINDMRSITLPGWVLYAMLAVGFLLMAAEFLKILLSRELYRGGELH